MGLHRRYARLIDDTPLHFVAGKKEEEIKIFRKLTTLFNGMMETLYTYHGAEFDINIIETPEVQKFIETHSSILDSSFRHSEMSDIMREKLENSDYVFSGMKTFHELNEAFPSMTDEDGKRKPFERFLNDVKKIDQTYNRNYLRAEYNFVAASADMAGRWEQIEEDGDRYHLQYRTAGDSRVRPEHASLAGVTLPPSDTFWDSYYPPNGWNCRCTAVQVLKSKYPATHHDEAMKRGATATAKDKKGMFRFNSGKKKKTVPDYNPYTISACTSCPVATGKIKLAKVYLPDNEVCAACKLLHKCAGDKSKSRRAVEKMHYLHEMEPLLKKKVKKVINGQTIKIKFNRLGNKHLYSDTIARTHHFHAEDLKNLDLILEKAIYVGEASKAPGHNNSYEHFFYFKAGINGHTIRLNVGKRVRKKGNGQQITEYVCYSINNFKESTKGGN